MTNFWKAAGAVVSLSLAAVATAEPQTRIILVEETSATGAKMQTQRREIGQIPGARRIAVPEGGSHALILTQAGKVLGWGDNTYGQLGTGDTNTVEGWRAVDGLDEVVAIAAGAQHGVALRADGAVWTWGSNYQGQLGDGMVRGHFRPARVEGLADVVSVAAGAEFTVALKRDGTVWVFGSNWGKVAPEELQRMLIQPMEVRGLRLEGELQVRAGKLDVREVAGATEIVDGKKVERQEVRGKLLDASEGWAIGWIETDDEAIAAEPVAARAVSQLTQPQSISSTPRVKFVSPAVSSGASQFYTFQFSDADGWQDLNVVNVLINTGLDNRNGCYLAYLRQTQTLYLVPDSGSGLLPGLVLPLLGGGVGTGSVSNSQCTITGAGSYVDEFSDTLEINVPMSFSTAFAGNKAVYMAARDMAGNNSGWQTAGAHGVPPLPVTFPKPASMSPASGSASNAILTFTFQDATNAMNLMTGWALINTALDGRNACYLTYYVPGNLVYLRPDNGGAAANMVLTGTNSLSNSQCTVSAVGSSTAIVGNQLVVNLNLTFQPAFTGPKDVWMAIFDNSSHVSPWEALAHWDVP